MKPDDKICYCFHITRGKLTKFVRLQAPRVPSQLSQCGGAGTGCGWCIPFLTKIFEQGSADLDALSAEEYARQRAAYIRSGQGKPPAGAAPLPESEDTSE